MRGRSCFVVSLAGTAQAATFFPIRWASVADGCSFLAPAANDLQKMAESPPKLILWDRLGRTSAADMPYFSVNSDHTISWNATGLCIEAAGEKHGDTVQLNHCEGGPTQLWKLLPYNHLQGTSVRKNLIKLKGSSKCIGIAADAGLSHAPVQLQECTADAAQSWIFENTAPPPTPHHSLMFLLKISAILPVLPMLLLSAWLLWRQFRRRAWIAGVTQGSTPSISDQGGISLVALLATSVRNAPCVPSFDMGFQGTASAVTSISLIALENGMVSTRGGPECGRSIPTVCMNGAASKPTSCEVSQPSLTESPAALESAHRPLKEDERPKRKGPNAVLDATRSSVDLRRHAVQLRDRGYTVIPNAGIDLELVADAQSACVAELGTLLDAVNRLGVDCIEQAYLFNELAARHRMRWDFRPSSSAAWTQVVNHAVGIASPIVECLHDLPPCPDDIWLTNLTRHVMPKSPQVLQVGAVISRPGARAQSFHVDAVSDHFLLAKFFPRHRMYNVFVPLVDIDEGGDGTMFWPTSHKKEAIARSGHLEDDAQAMAEMVAPACPAGGIILFDYRLMHRGMPNVGRERAIAYATLSTGWARDSSNFPTNLSLWDQVDALPLDPQERHERQIANSREAPFWSQLNREIDAA